MTSNNIYLTSHDPSPAEEKWSSYKLRYGETFNSKDGFFKYDTIEGYEDDFKFQVFFSKTDAVFIICFLAIYILLSFLVKFFFQSSNNEHELTTVRIFDIIILVVLIIVIVYYYTDKSDSEKEKNFEDRLNDITEFVNYKYSSLFALLSIFVFYLIIYLFKIPMTVDKRSVFIFITELILWIIFFVCILNVFFYRVFDFSLIQKISDWLKKMESSNDDDTSSSKITTDVTVDKKTCGNGNICGNTTTTTTTTTTKKSCYDSDSSDSDDDSDDEDSDHKKEVYNVSNNLYNYEEAQSICKSYGATIATYDQIEEAYEKGGEWCNYGWSEGQMIYFPTQKDTWNKLQKSDSTKNNCGRPGINGGYMSNPYLKFGVNCYGVKPSPTDADLAEMKAQREQIYATSKEEKELDEKVEYWKKNADKLLNLNSFNNNKWSEY